MTTDRKNFRYLGTVLGTALILTVGGQSLLAQQTTPPDQIAAPPLNQTAVRTAGQTLTTQQLNDLVAPIALYPDPLVSQILVASTYPLELVQLSQWLERNSDLTGTALVQAAEQQNWDPSVQALVVFPDLVKRLNQDITWTGNLGNTFLTQQTDVMDAIQRMRLSAQQGGKLSSTPQQTVTTSYDNGPPVIEIQPADPQVVYVPYYNPVSIWGPSYYYPYANWYYPPFYGGTYLGFGFGIRMGGFFGGGWGGWGGWGWSPGWGNRSIIVNNNFISRNNFNGGFRGNGNGISTWSHDASHRQGVGYSSRALSSRYSGAPRQPVGRQGVTRSYAPYSGSQRSGRSFAPSGTSVNRGNFNGSVQRGSSGINRGSGTASRGTFGGGGVNRGGGMSRGSGGAIRGGGGSGAMRGGGGGIRGSGGGGSRGGGGGGSRGGGGGRR
jgi:hypothetical protein